MYDNDKKTLPAPVTGLTWQVLFLKYLDDASCFFVAYKIVQSCISLKIL
jgi:hypothetical protein